MGRAQKEEEITRFWEKDRTFEKSVAQRPKDKQYVFYDGPPFATGTPHYGSILGSTVKDVFGRYWTMKGYRVERTWGWDCHGLPIEKIVEKKLDIKEKKSINVMGVGTFNETCRAQVLEFTEEWKKTVRKIGRWVDIENSYKTMDNKYMESVWHIFKKLYDEKNVYEGMKILPYCPNCETVLANAEIAMDNSYKDVTEVTATARFKLKGEDAAVLAWTTTPWTLIGNVALAVNGDMGYVKVSLGGEKLIIAEKRLHELKEGYTVLEHFKGADLVGKEYEPLYPLPSKKKGHYIVDGGAAVTGDEGTGVVHLAIYGEFDYEMIQKHDLPVLQHIDGQGKLVLGPPEWRGMWFKAVDKKVLEDLETRGLLFKAERHTHSYPFCYRCDTPLFYNAVDSWFLNIQKIKKQLIAENEKIDWHPGHFKHGRYLNILETAPDWTISRNRFWAAAIPVWKCGGCAGIAVIGSVAELQKRAVEKVPSDVDLHKHVVDGIHLKCGCGGTMTRIPEVFDCWFESASMPYASKHWPFENKEWFKDNYPAYFVAEYVNQIRTWFYYMEVLGVLLFKEPPFRNISVTGVMLAQDGEKMSKSKGNFPEPEKIIGAYGADALRFYLMASPLMNAQDSCFSEENIKDAYRRVVLLENVTNFYRLFGTWNTTLDAPGTRNVLDRWIASRLENLTREVTRSLDAYDTVAACSSIAKFIDDLSTWYVRRSRGRFKGSDESGRKEAAQTLGHALLTLSRLSAPIIPFIAEEIHLALRESNPRLAGSVHLEALPECDPRRVDSKLEQEMAQARKVVSAALELRDRNKIPVRQPLAALRLRGVEFEPEILTLIQEEVNVKKVTAEAASEFGIELDTAMTPELVQEGIARDAIRKINGLRSELGLTLKDTIVVFLDFPDPLVLESIRCHEDAVKSSLQAARIETGVPEGVAAKEIELGKFRVRVGIRRTG